MAHDQKNNTRCEDLEKICRRVREKSESYVRYDFSDNYNDFLKAFFDLAQEYDLLDDFYRICVAVPLEMTGLDSTLYLYDEKKEKLFLVCDSKRGIVSPREEVKYPLTLAQESYELDDSYVSPVYSKPPTTASGFGPKKQKIESERQKFLWNSPVGRDGMHRLLGMYAVRPAQGLKESDKFFFVKYANRIGYNLHNRLIARQNIDHLKFINSLVMDIEHNVIVPNMYFKYLFNQLKKKIVELQGLKKEIIQLIPEEKNPAFDECLTHCDTLNNDLLHYQEELVEHHANISLFLESLFRREHFERGHLVLHPKRCLLEKEVILPQLEHYASRLERAGVVVEKPRDMEGEEFPTLVDIGLLAQVYANFFSNGAKYAREVIDHNGNPRKSITYGREIIENFPVQGKRGIKFNVFTTGPHIPPDEQEKLFQEGVRGSNTENIDGTGHGLAFVRHVIELHGGKVGYEPTSQGNNFYFILPLPPAEMASPLISKES